MQYLIITVQEQKDGFIVNVDNLAREDSTEKEREFADNLEQIYVAIAEKVSGEMARIPGTRYDTN